MARAYNIHIVVDRSVMSDGGQRIIAAFSVLHECVTFLKRQNCLADKFVISTRDGQRVGYTEGRPASEFVEV